MAAKKRAMAAKKKRKVWRISDIVRAICREQGKVPEYRRPTDGSSDGAYVLGECADGRSAEAVIAECSYSLPVLLGRQPGYDIEGTAAALVATARRLRVPMVDA
jgi:hypothetical protein